MHLYKSQQYLPITIEEAWHFFSTPKNLARITPPGLDFKIKSDLKDVEIFDGMTIDYTVKPLFGIRVRWKTLLKDIIPFNEFTDIQIKGPYKMWIHKHTFAEHNNGVMMYDEVKYKLPFGALGYLLNIVFIRKRVEEIFSYRKMVLDKLFCNGVSA